MNYFFEKIKQKLNKSTTQQINNAKDFLQSFQVTARPFDRQEVNRRIESISQNCNKWTTYIVNEPSMGLYFCQNHNRKCIESRCKSIGEHVKQTKKKEVVVGQISKTNQEVREMGTLSGEWFSRVSAKLESIK